MTGRRRDLQAADLGQQQVPVERLGDELLGRRRRRVARHEDDPHLRVLAHQVAREIAARHPRHHHVGQQDVELAAPGLGERVDAARRRHTTW